MRVSPVIVTTIFHPVGQGLFVSGSFYGNDCTRKFTWFFDCGAHHDQGPVESEVNRLETELHKYPVDMFCISHFDKDHISGAQLLLQGLGAKVLILPYMNLTDRMQLLIEEGADDWYADFLVDPAAFIFRITEGRTRVIYVEGGPDQPDQPPDLDDPDQEDSNDSRDDNYPLNPHFPQGDPVSVADAPGLHALGKQAHAEVITHDQTVSLGGRWEFVFFNETRRNKPIAKLQDDVLALVNENRHEDGTYNGKEMLCELRKLYEVCFGYGGQNANRISLVMYSGPTKRRSASFPPFRHHPKYHRYCWEIMESFDIIAPNTDVRDQGTLVLGTLLTGDIFFDREPKIRAAEVHYSPKRWRRIDILQVPHHGSSHSWYAGASALFNNRVSVFSAGSGSRRHPGAMVKGDLVNSGPTYVNEHKGLFLVGWI